MYKNHIANIILNGKKVQVFLLILGTRQGSPLSPLLFNTVLKVLANTIRQERGKMYIEIGKKERKLSLLSKDIIIYVEKSERITKNPLIRRFVTSMPGTNKQGLICQSQLFSYMEVVSKYN